MVTARFPRPRRSRVTKPIRHQGPRLHVEQLEIRAVPATIVWDGGPTFSTTYGKQVGDPAYLGYFDFNGDGHIDSADFGQFSLRMFTTLP